VACVAAVALGASAAAASESTGDLPVWSPDGKKIALVGPSRFGSGRSVNVRVELMSPSGAGRRVVVAMDRGEGAMELRWADDRHLLASASPTGVLRRIDIITRKVVKLGPSPGGLGSGVGPLSLAGNDTFVVSANGRRVAYTADSPYGNKNLTPEGRIPDLFAVGVVSSLGRQGRRLQQPVHASDAYPSLSPNGRKVVFARSLFAHGKTTQPPSLMIQSVNGGKARPLNIQGDRPVWSPNGRWIAFQQLAKAASPGSQVPWRLEIVSLSGGRPKALFSANVDEPLSLSWSPDSRRLAFLTQSGRMGTVTLSGRVAFFALHGLTFATVPEAPPEWSPDGKTLVVAATPKGRRNETVIYAINPDGQRLHRIDY
jgi:Tol biopolymer transport system component